MPTDILPRPSCADERDPEALAVDEARQRILAAVAPIAFSQRVALREALGRALAEAVVSPQDVPSHTNSAMDGYALAGAGLPPSGTAELALAGEALAGHPFRGEVGAGQCVRIMTGAPMPAGTDTVVMQEQAEALAGRVRIGSGHKPGQNVRRAGEDIAAGDAVHAPGRVLTPADLGLLERVGSVGFWKIAMKPGRPLTFGRIGDALFFGLPGNPVAVIMTFYQLVQPALIKLMTGREEPPLLVTAECRSRLRKRAGRTELPRGVLGRGTDGGLTVELTGRQGSGVLRSMSLADCFIVLPQGQGDVEPGDRVLVQPFAGLI